MKTPKKCEKQQKTAEFQHFSVFFGGFFMAEMERFELYFYLI